MVLKGGLRFQFLGFLLLNLFALSLAQSKIRTINWVLMETNYTRMCVTKSMLTMNGLYPGPTLYARRGETVRVNILNQGGHNVTIHWHGVKQPRNPWSDGPEFITQCPIQAGANFTYEVVLSDEIGTLWWHAHSDWSRATVHGHLIIYPQDGTTYPFPKPDGEFPLFLGSWFNIDANSIIETALATGGPVRQSDGYTINGQPGDLYPCSRNGTTKFPMEKGKTYLLRIVNGVMNEEMFFAVANHTLTVVGLDGAYVKPITTNYIFITPGQTMDILITANQPQGHYYMAARAYAGVEYDNSTTTAILQYTGNYTTPTTIPMPSLPDFHDHNATQSFIERLRALATKEHPINVPQKINKRLIIAVSLNTLPCNNTTINGTCLGPQGTRLSASLNNISFQAPSLDVLQAYYNNIPGIFETDFPLEPPEVFNYTANVTPANARTPERATKARVIDFNSTVELVFQGTNVLRSAENHPLHLHGYSFYVVGYGFGNFNSTTDPSNYNLVDPPEMNTVAVPINGWAAVRFTANNPGVWFMHCHLERHSSWGMDTVLIVKNGKHSSQKVRRPPAYLNPC